MKTIKIKNVILTVSKLDAITIIRDWTLNLKDALTIYNILTINKEPELEAEFVNCDLNKIATFNVIKTENEMKQEVEAAYFWMAGLSTKEQEYIKLIILHSMPTV